MDHTGSDEIQIAFKVIVTMMYIYAVIFVTICLYTSFVHINDKIEEYRLDMIYQSIDQEVSEKKNSRFRIMNDKNH